MAGAARFLEAAMLAAPIAAVFGAAWGVLTIFLGIANTNVGPNLAVAAPGIAEAILSVATGLLTLLLAVVAYGVVKPRRA
jgi:biopolymer transport protein ExbB/TolQ